MKATITSFALKGPLKFFLLSTHALRIIKQLKTTDFIESKKQGFWTKHYTMTLWKSEEELKTFATSGTHLKAMKENCKIGYWNSTVRVVGLRKSHGASLL